MTWFKNGNRSISEKRTKIIEVRDESDYDPEFCHDGGKYWFGERFLRIGSKWFVEETTSADFCPYCRSWDHYSCESPKEIDFLDMIRKISDYVDEDSEDIFIEIE